MTAVILLAAFALWAAVGYGIWRAASLKRPTRGNGARLAPVAFTLAWLGVPLADELLGSLVFNRQCEVMPASMFYGPVSVGLSPFYDADGTPNWKTPEEFNDIDLPRHQIGRGHTSITSQMFTATIEHHQIRVWPIPITHITVTHSYRPTTQRVMVEHRLSSPGGWLKRVTGWGDHAPYVCSKDTDVRPTREWIKF